MATLSMPLSRAAVARNRVSSAVPSAVAAPTAPPRSKLIERIADTNIHADIALEETKLPSLLEEAESLTKSFEALQSNGGVARQEGSQARAARRYFSFASCTVRTNSHGSVGVRLALPCGDPLAVHATRRTMPPDT
jgi:hypothetical protein